MAPRLFAPSVPPSDGAPGAFRAWTPGQAASVFFLCVLSRLATSIHYIEDADSLRFALSLSDYDVTRLQPQFPGYPIFCFFAKLLSLSLGGYGLAFAALGGLGLFALVHYGLALARWRLLEPRGLALTALIFFNPMLWLMGNRYMSDLSGGALALAAFYHLSRGDSRRHVAAGFCLTGLLAGWRLSYAPFLAIPLFLALARPGEPAWRARGERVLAGLAGTAAWLIPLILITGLKTLIATARYQTSGHFDDFGGTYRTEPEWGLRAIRLVGHAWTDGLGAWEPGRHGATLLVALGAILFLALSLGRAARSGLPRPTARLLLAAWLGYALWIFFFQNVVHQTRHVLPLVTPLLMALAAGVPSSLAAARASLARRAAATAFVVFMAAYAFVGLSLAMQHRRPSALAQAKAYVETFADPGLTVITAPWVAKCLSAQGVKVRYLTVESPAELAALKHLDPGLPLATVGNYSDHLGRPVVARRVFYHNPYVNRLGSRIEVFRYGRGEARP